MLKGDIVRAGDVISIDGAAGTVTLGEVARIKPDVAEDFATIMRWTEECER